jgi:hypothetical protein
LLTLTRQFAATLSDAARTRPVLDFGSDNLGPPQNTRFWGFIYNQNTAPDPSIPLSDWDISVVVDELLFTTDNEHLTSPERCLLAIAGLEWLTIHGDAGICLTTLTFISRFDDFSLLTGPRRDIIVQILHTLASGTSLRRVPPSLEDQAIAKLFVQILNSSPLTPPAEIECQAILQKLCETQWPDQRKALAHALEQWQTKLPITDPSLTAEVTRWIELLCGPQESDAFSNDSDDDIENPPPS